MRTLNFLILNLMPTKEITERQLINRLSNTSYPINITWLTTATYQCKHASQEHMQKYYHTFSEVKERYFDGFIITGAPIEHLTFNEVLYWKELTEIMEWSKSHVTSTMHICWGAQAGIYYHYGVEKQPLSQKLSGVYANEIIAPDSELLEGIGDVFYSPHSCYTKIIQEDVESVEDLTLLAGSKETDVFLACSNDHRQIFVFGHPEYDVCTLDQEYRRDLKKPDINPAIPANYYSENDPTNSPIYRWYKPSCRFFSNWIMNCVAKDYVLEY